MIKLIVNFIIFILLIIALQGISYMIGEKLNILREERTPFECGFEFSQEARIPFSIAYFILTLIFFII